MRILIVEDEPYRIKWFKEKLIGNTLDITKDVEEAKEWLGKNEYDYIFLDHDLTEEQYSQGYTGNYRSEDNKSGYEVALFLEKMVDLQNNAQIFIHSLSPSGSERMMKALCKRNCRRVPFTVLMDKLKLT